MDVEVRPAGEPDLPALVAAMGQARFFGTCLRRQAEGAGRLFVAVAVAAGGEVPVVVGDVFLSRAPASEGPIRRHLAGVPAVVHLEVARPFRRRGIATALVAAAEAEAAAGRATQVYLGVEVDNAGGRRLYERLGYEEWPHGPVATGWVVEGHGRRWYHRTTVHVLVKRLDGAG